MKFSEGTLWDYPVAAGAVINVGAAVIANASGYATQASAPAENQVILGIATESVDNTGGANGAVRITVLKRGIVDATIVGGIAQAQVGKPAYLDGYDAANQRPKVHGAQTSGGGGGGQSTNRTALGTVVSVEGSVARIQLTTV